MLLKATDSPEKELMYARALTKHSKKSSRLFIEPSPTYAATFMKSVHAFSSNMANKQTNRQIGFKT